MSNALKDWTPRCTILSCLGIYAVVIAFLARNPALIAGEPSLYLDCAKLVLLGQRPYTDFLLIDWSAPIAAFVVPAMLANATPALAPLICNLFSLAVSMLSTILCCILLLPHRHHREWQSFHFLITALAGSNVILVFQLGQPQYLTFVFLVPYIIVRWLNYQGVRSNRIAATASGLGAACGLSLNPLTILIPLFLEAHWATRAGSVSRLFSYETVACAVSFIICFGSLLFLGPDQLNNFTTIVHPTMMWNTQPLDYSTIERAAAPDRRDLLLIGCVLSFFGLVLARQSTLLPPFAMVFLCGLLIAVIEQQGLSRQYILMLASSTLSIGLMLAILYQWIRTTYGTAKPLVTLMSKRVNLTLWLIAPAIASGIYMASLERRPMLESWQAVDGTLKESAGIRSLVEQYSSAGEPVLFLQKRTFPGFPLIVQTQRSVGSRLLDPGCILTLADSPLSENQAVTTKLCSMLAEDIVGKRPALIFVEEGSMQQKLETTGVAKLIKQNYAHVGSWCVNSANIEPLEYFGTRQPVKAYIRKDKLESRRGAAPQ